MKYCSFCGCYIPDDWDNCPACGKENYTPELIYYNKTIDIDVNKTLWKSIVDGNVPFRYIIED